MVTMRIILTILEAVACLLAFAVALYVLLKKHSANCPCDTCDHLTHKGKWSKKYFRYDCDMQADGFDVPPQYCRDYVERKRGGQDDV